MSDVDESASESLPVDCSIFRGDGLAIESVDLSFDFFIGDNLMRSMLLLLLSPSSSSSSLVVLRSMVGVELDRQCEATWNFYQFHWLCRGN